MAISEFDVIARFFARHGARRDDVLLGIGDDAALLRVAADRTLVVAMDTLVAGRHFPEDTAAADIGFKALAVNLSDLAAMGASPAWATLSLTMPEVNERWLEDFSAGFFQLADRFGVDLVAQLLKTSHQFKNLVSQLRCAAVFAADTTDQNREAKRP